MDRFDTVALFGFLGLVILSAVTDIDALVLAAALGGFVLSLSLWQFYLGRVWEGLGLLVWVGSAVLVVVGIDGQPVLTVAFLLTLLVGMALQFGGRYGVLPDVWRPDEE